MLPIEPMKVKNAATGPIIAWTRTCQKAGSPSPPLPTKSVWKKAAGTKAAMIPATVKPTVTSFQTICHSMAYRMPSLDQPCLVVSSFDQVMADSSSV